MNTTSRQRYGFADFVLDVDAAALCRRGVAIRLKPQVFAVLVELVANAGTLVTRDALIERLWGRCEVDYDANLNTIVRQIRRALGDPADAPQFVETVPRRGYRFVASVHAVTEGGQRALPRSLRSPLYGLAAGFAALALLGGLQADAPQAPASTVVAPGLHADYAQAKLALRNGDSDTAMQSFRRIVDASPDFVAARACLALAILQRNGGTTEAVAEARQLIDDAMIVDPHDPVLLTVAAQVALQYERRPDAARRMLDAALTRDAGDSHTHVLSAWQHSISDRHDEARLAIARALRLDPLSAHVAGSAAQIYAAAGDAADAERMRKLARRLSQRT